MTVPLRHPVAVRRVGPLASFELRCWARAYLWSIGELSLDEAVDRLQLDAERDGLVERLGQDAVQAILRDAFHRVRS
jgi:hypothetical protein